MPDSYKCKSVCTYLAAAWKGYTKRSRIGTWWRSERTNHRFHERSDMSPSFLYDSGRGQMRRSHKHKYAPRTDHVTYRTQYR